MSTLLVFIMTLSSASIKILNSRFEHLAPYNSPYPWYHLHPFSKQFRFWNRNLIGFIVDLLIPYSQSFSIRIMRFVEGYTLAKSINKIQKSSFFIYCLLDIDYWYRFICYYILLMFISVPMFFLNPVYNDDIYLCLLLSCLSILLSTIQSRILNNTF